MDDGEDCPCSDPSVPSGSTAGTSCAATCPPTSCSTPSTPVTAYDGASRRCYSPSHTLAPQNLRTAHRRQRPGPTTPGSATSHLQTQEIHRHRAYKRGSPTARPSARTRPAAARALCRPPVAGRGAGGARIGNYMRKTPRCRYDERQPSLIMPYPTCANPAKSSSGKPCRRRSVTTRGAK